MAVVFQTLLSSASKTVFYPYILVKKTGRSVNRAFSFNVWSGVNPGFFLGGGAPLRNGEADWWLDVNTSCIRKPQVMSARGAHPLHPPPRSAPVQISERWASTGLPTRPVQRLLCYRFSFLLALLNRSISWWVFCGRLLFFGCNVPL